MRPAGIAGIAGVTRTEHSLGQTRGQVTKAVETQQPERVEKLVKWYQAHQRRLTVIGAVAVGVWFTLTARSRREAFAQRELSQARMAADAGNLALASNDLSRLVTSYGGTAAAEEAALVLAQVRLLQGQAQLAVVDLQSLVAGGLRDQFRAVAYQLLGATLEQLGRVAEAGDAYLEGATGPGPALLLADLLLDAGRAYMAVGDVQKAVAAYRRVAEEFKDTPGALEAELRLGELRQTDMET